jgi:hypothetical protein
MSAAVVSLDRREGDPLVPDARLVGADQGGPAGTAIAKRKYLLAAGGDSAALTLADLEAIEGNLQQLRDALALFQRLSPEVLVTPFTGSAQSCSWASALQRSWSAPWSARR